MTGIYCSSMIPNHRTSINPFNHLGLSNQYYITNSFHPTPDPGTPLVPAGQRIFGILASFSETPETSQKEGRNNGSLRAEIDGQKSRMDQIL